MAKNALPDGTEETAKAAPRPERKAGRKAAAKIPMEDLHGPSPNVATNLAIADIALRGGTMLARQAVERALLGRKYAPSKAAKILKERTMGESLLHGALAKVALRSVPGAIAIGGALLAKTLYDRTKAREAQRESEAALAQAADEDEAGGTGPAGS